MRLGFELLENRFGMVGRDLIQRPQLGAGRNNSTTERLNNAFFSTLGDWVPGPRDLAWFTPAGRELRDEDWQDMSSRTLGMFINRSTLNGDYESDHSFLLIMHSGGEPIDFLLPDHHWAREWKVVVDTTQPGSTPLEATYKPKAKLKLFAHSMLVLQEVE